MNVGFAKRALWHDPIDAKEPGLGVYDGSDSFGRGIVYCLIGKVSLQWVRQGICPVHGIEGAAAGQATGQVSDGGFSLVAKVECIQVLD